MHIDELKNDNKSLIIDLDFKVYGKDKVCIIGDNGTGKSTLLKAIYEQLKDRSDMKVGYMPQNYYEMMDYDMDPVSYLCLTGENKTRVSTCLGALKFTSEEMLHSISGLSEGQKCKIMLLKLILEKCDVLLLDEPTRNLSALSNPRVREMFNEYKGCIICTSHDRKFINEVADKIYMLEDKHLRVLD